MNRWYRRRRWIYAGLGLMLALDAGAYFGWVRNLRREPERARVELRGLERDVSQRATEVARLRRVRQDLPQLQPRIEAFVKDRLLAERTGYSQVVADLSEAAAEAGVQLNKADYKSKEEAEQKDLLQVNVTALVEGNYTSLLRYLEALERSPRFYLIHALGVVGAQGGQLRLELELATYFRRSRT